MGEDIKKFIIQSFRFSLILILVCVSAELLVPDSMLTHRSWEMYRIKNPRLFLGPFYPNRSSLTDEVGDLAHHTRHSVLKPDIHWETDKYGFRNSHFDSKADVVFIGDSNIAGSSLSQESTLPEILKQNVGLSVTNLAPSSINEFGLFLNAGLIDKPKYLIYGLIERNVPSIPPLQTYTANENLMQLKEKVWVNTLFTHVDRLSKQRVKNYLRARFSSVTGSGYQSPYDSNMMFFQGKDSYIMPDSVLLGNLVSKLSDYSAFCSDLGIEFIFLMIPNKESVYPHLVPMDGSVFLNDLSEKLFSEKINHINLQDYYSSDSLLFHVDDSHWNLNGVRIACDQISDMID